MADWTAVFHLMDDAVIAALTLLNLILWGSIFTLCRRDRY